MKTISIWIFFACFCLTINFGHTREINTADGTLTIINELADKYPELVELISNTESMDKIERQYWFDTLPKMTDIQINRLYNILNNEKKKIGDLNLKYKNFIIEKLRAEGREGDVDAIFEKFIEFSNNYKSTSAPEEKFTPKKYMLPVYTKADFARIEIIPIANIDEDHIVMTKYEYKKLNDGGKIDEIDDILLIRYFENFLLKDKKYSEIFPSEFYSEFISLAIEIAVKRDRKDLILLLSNHTSDAQNSVLSATGQYAKLARRNFLEAAQPGTKIENVGFLMYAARELTELRQKKGCEVLCAEFLVGISSNTAENMEYLISSFEKIVNTDQEYYLLPTFLDFAIAFNNDLNLSGFITLRDRLEGKFTKLNNKNEPLHQGEWYKTLQHALLTGKIEELYSSILKRYMAALEGGDLDEFKSTEGRLLEAAIYSSIELIKLGRTGDARVRLASATDIGIHRGSPARKYIEHGMRDYLLRVLAVGFRAKGPDGVTYTAGKKERVFSFGNKYAILIGISDYTLLPSELTVGRKNLADLIDLRYADNDAVGFERFLNNSGRSGGGWQITTLLNGEATMSKVRRKLDETLSRAQENDLVYIFFSGHGRNAGYSGGDPFLMTADAGQKDLYVGIELSWLAEKIQKSKAKHIVAFLDACHSGSFDGQKGNNSLAQSSLLDIYDQSEPTKIVFTSGTGNQISLEDDTIKHGYFTYYLLDALENGAAPDFHQDGLVDLYETEDYVRNKVRDATKGSQVPQVPNISDFSRDIRFPMAIR